MSTSQGPLTFPACDSSVVILGDSLEVVQVTINPGPAQVLISPVAQRRNGVSIRNNNPIGGAALYIAETSAKATTATGWPITAQGGITISIKEDVTVYAVSDAGATDVRLIFTGD